MKKQLLCLIFFFCLPIQYSLNAGIPDVFSTVRNTLSSGLQAMYHSSYIKSGCMTTLLALGAVGCYKACGKAAYTAGLGIGAVCVQLLMLGYYVNEN